MPTYLSNTFLCLKYVVDIFALNEHWIVFCDICFSLDSNEFIDHGRLVTSLENGQNIRSEPSIMTLDGKRNKYEYYI